MTAEIEAEWYCAEIKDDDFLMARFYNPRGVKGLHEHNANLWAHGYPALLEAVQAYFARSGGVTSGEREWFHLNPSGIAAARVALYDAMKACDPPAPPKKLTRREVILEVLETARRDPLLLPEEVADMVLAFLDRLDEAQP